MGSLSSHLTYQSSRPTLDHFIHRLSEHAIKDLEEVQPAQQHVTAYFDSYNHRDILSEWFFLFACGNKTAVFVL